MHSLRVRFSAVLVLFSGSFPYFRVFSPFAKRNWKDLPQIEFLRCQRQDYS